MVAFFKVAYWTVTILEFLASIAIIIVLAVQRGVILDACTEAYPTEASDTCSVAFRNAMIIFSVIVVIVNFFQVQQLKHIQATNLPFFVSSILQ